MGHGPRVWHMWSSLSACLYLTIASANKTRLRADPWLKPHPFQNPSVSLTAHLTTVFKYLFMSCTNLAHLLFHVIPLLVFYPNLFFLPSRKDPMSSLLNFCLCVSVQNHNPAIFYILSFDLIEDHFIGFIKERWYQWIFAPGTLFFWIEVLSLSFPSFPVLSFISLVSLSHLRLVTLHHWMSLLGINTLLSHLLRAIFVQRTEGDRQKRPVPTIEISINGYIIDGLCQDGRTDGLGFQFNSPQCSSGPLNWFLFQYANTVWNNGLVLWNITLHQYTPRHFLTVTFP